MATMHDNERTFPEGAPEDPAMLYPLLMRDTVGFWQVAAAHRLVFRSEPLRRWLLANNLIRLYEANGHPAAKTHFEEALELVRTTRGGRQLPAGRSLDPSGYAVLTIAAQLAGQGDPMWIRHVVTDLEEADARHVAESHAVRRRLHGRHRRPHRRHSRR